MIFKLKRGSHYQGDKKFMKGDTVESSHDLVTLFGKEKFERDYPAEQKAGIATINKPNIPSPVAKADVDKEPGEYGEDITSEFSTAEEAEVTVFEKSNWCTVVDKEDGEVLNEKKLRRKDIEPFLEQYLTDEDVDEDVDGD